MATKNDPEIAKRVQKRQVKKAAENVAGLTTAEKLTRASKEEVVEAPITYSDGDFMVEVRIALVSEQQHIQKLKKQVQDGLIGGDDILETGLAELFAEHTLDESLDVEFWLQADISPTIYQNILYAILELTEDKVRKAQEIIEAQSFRKD